MSIVRVATQISNSFSRSFPGVLQEFSKFFPGVKVLHNNNFIHLSIAIFGRTMTGLTLHINQFFLRFHDNFKIHLVIFIKNLSSHVTNYSLAIPIIKIMCLV